jgi:hypothetical protein
MAPGYEAILNQFHANRLLFGDPAEDSIVAVEIATPTEVEIFRRRKRQIERERRPLRLFVLLEDRALLDRNAIPCDLIPLTGDFRFR